MNTDFSKSTGYSSYGENARFPDSLARQHIGKICIEGENNPPPPPRPPHDVSDHSVQPTRPPYSIFEKSIPPSKESGENS